MHNYIELSIFMPSKEFARRTVVKSFLYLPVNSMNFCIIGRIVSAFSFGS